ncbi:cell division protein ZipA [Neptunicella sp.]|uniref:cell division protein ZipA n=1 Tax=Neptunicella sp. TaxID=2125986 RepID=UPI003F692953
MDLQLALIILGGFAITGILVHGLWTIRNNSQKRADWDPVQPDIDEDEEDSLPEPVKPVGGFDHDGIGQVRVLPREEKTPEQRPDNVEDKHDAHPSSVESPVSSVSTPVSETVPAFSALDDELSDSISPVTETPRTETKAVSAQHQYPDPPSSLLLSGEQTQSQQNKVEPSIRQSEFLEDTPAEGERQEPQLDDQKTAEAEPLAEQKISLAEQAKKLVKREKPLKKIRRTEPRIAEDQLRIDFDDQPPVEEMQQSEPADTEQEQEVLVLNVKMPDGKTIPGSALLPMLLTLGLKFGDQDIFHRHVNTNGKGPVLFSLANMFRPGVFDIDNMENFTTRGISLFMVLPIEGDPRQVFNMMHNASRKIADEFGAQILDGRRATLTKQALQQYTDKIRESERRRMLRKN